VIEKYPSRKCNCAFVQNHVSLRQTFDCVLFGMCVSNSEEFDSICRLIVTDQQHAPVLPVFATFSHNKLELALDESGSTRNSIPHTSVTLSYTCSDFTQTADHGYRRSKDSALLPELE
jgi:hypothetical protein